MLTTDKERVSARIPRESRNLLEKAAALSGATVNQFVVQAAVKEAQALLSREQTIVLTAVDSDRFFAALERPQPRTRPCARPPKHTAVPGCMRKIEPLGPQHDRESFD